MNLLERWAEKEYDSNLVMRELRLLTDNAKNWHSFFCERENGEKIRYCVPYKEDYAYGRKTGICYSEEFAVDAIKFILGQYGFLLIPWFKQEFNNSVDLYVKTDKPVAFIIDENNAEKEVFDAMFVFEKCSNKAGFCVSRVVPILDRQEAQDD